MSSRFGCKIYPIKQSYNAKFGTCRAERVAKLADNKSSESDEYIMTAENILPVTVRREEREPYDLIATISVKGVPGLALNLTDEMLNRMEIEGMVSNGIVMISKKGYLGEVMTHAGRACNQLLALMELKEWRQSETNKP